MFPWFDNGLKDKHAGPLYDKTRQPVKGGFGAGSFIENGAKNSSQEGVAVSGLNPRLDPLGLSSVSQRDQTNGAAAPSLPPVHVNVRSLASTPIDALNEQVYHSLFAHTSRVAPGDALQIVQYDPTPGAHRGQKRKREVGGEMVVSKNKVQINIDTGEVVGQFINFVGNNRRKKRIMDPESARQTALARRKGVCKRCKILKQKCGLHNVEFPYAPCGPCSVANPRIHRHPCFQDGITVVKFFRIRPTFAGPLDSTARKQVFEVSELTPALIPAKRLVIKQDIGLPFTVEIAEFIPIPDDKTTYSWKDSSGQQRTMPMPHYCLTNLDQTANNMVGYARLSRNMFLASLLQGTNDITWDTIQMAVKFTIAFPTSVVRFALDLWSTCRIIEQPWNVCAPNRHGFNTIRDPSNPWNGKSPVTPIMDTQLDQIVIRCILIPLSKTLLRILDDMIHNHNEPKNWFEIYLTAFVLLTSAESVCIHGKNFAARYGVSTRYASHSRMEELFHGANIVLAYFHFACNGSAPLQIDWSDAKVSTKMAELNPVQRAYMMRTQMRIKEREVEIRDLYQKHKYDTHLYWTHQLWIPDWKGKRAHVENEIP